MESGVRFYSVDEFRLDPKWLIDPKHLFVGPQIEEGTHAKVYEGKGRQHREDEINVDDIDIVNELRFLAPSRQNGSNNSVTPVHVVAAEAGVTIPPKSMEDYTKSTPNSSSDDDNCPTCFEEYSEENPKITTKCNHHYHLCCILEWQERNNTCPFCRQVIDFDEL